MKKVFFILIIVAAVFKFWNREPGGIPPTSAIEAAFRCISMQGYAGNPNWSTAQGDGWHKGQIIKNVGVMTYSIPYRARISEFRFERGQKLTASGGPSKDGTYYKVRIFRKIERSYEPGDADPATLAQILPKTEVFDRTIFFYPYLNGTWRHTETIGN